jgi:pimeloyl-ACP methyl ester carboxylesterase
MLTASCGGSPPPPPFRPAADVKQLMTAVVDPAADVIWGSVGTIVSEQGIEERAPKTDEEWAAVLNSAFVITESGNLMMMGGRAKDTGEWMRQSQALIDVGIRTVKAAEARDKDAIFTLGGDIYEVCAKCHQTYAVEAAGIPK